MGTAHCLGHSSIGQWMDTVGDQCLADCRYIGDSSVGQPAHGIQACSGHSVVPLCDVSSAGIAPCGDHRHQGPWDQCSHCIHMVGTGLLSLMDPQSAQGRKLHTAALCSLPCSGTLSAGSAHPDDKK